MRAAHYLRPFDSAAAVTRRARAAAQTVRPISVASLQRQRGIVVSRRSYRATLAAGSGPETVTMSHPTGKCLKWRG